MHECSMTYSIYFYNSELNKLKMMSRAIFDIVITTLLLQKARK